MRKRPLGLRIFGAIVLPAVLALSACGGGGSEDAAADRGIAVKHAQGSTTVPKSPAKVVVFDVGVLTTLDELGVKVTGVPEIKGLPDNLKKYGGDGFTKVGSLFEPDYEKVNGLDPDVILVAGRSSAAYKELAKIAPTVDLTVDNKNFLASFRERTETLGQIFGKEADVKKRLDAIDAAAAKVKGDAGKAEGLIVLTTGGKISAYGAGSRFGLVHDVLGVPPADPNVKADVHGQAVSAEFIADTDPDLLYVIDRDSAIGEAGQAAEKVLDNTLVNGTKAAKNDKIFYLDSFAWYVAPTALSSVDKMIQEVGNSLS